MTPKYRLKILFLIVTCTVHKSVGTVAKNNEVQDDFSISKPLANNPDRDARCGGVLKAFDEFSTLSYNMDKPTDHRYQSCIWTIEAINRTLIKINVTKPLYAYDNLRFISVGYFNKSNYDLINSFTWIKLPPSYDPQYLEVPGPVVFVHYSSTLDHPQFGFRLTYAAAGERHSSIFNFDNYFLEGEYGIFKYPLSGQYKNNQRTTIVIKPYSRISNPSSGVYSYLHVVNNGIEDSSNCNDSVNVYGYGESSASWNRNKTVCGTIRHTVAEFWYPRNDPLILTFKSDDSQVGGGFEIRWMERHFIPESGVYQV